jgi:ERCC4-related helicase
VFTKEHSKSQFYLTYLLRCALAVSLKWIGQASRGVQRGVNGVEQRQIAQQGTTVKVALAQKYCTSSP